MAVVLLVLEQQILMPFVLKCDVDSIRHILHQLESELSKKNSIFVISNYNLEHFIQRFFMLQNIKYPLSSLNGVTEIETFSMLVSVCACRRQTKNLMLIVVIIFYYIDFCIILIFKKIIFF